MTLEKRINKLVDNAKKNKERIEKMKDKEGNPKPGATKEEKKAYAKKYLMGYGYSKEELNDMSEESLMKLMYTIERKTKEKKE